MSFSLTGKSFDKFTSPYTDDVEAKITFLIS